MIEFEYLTSPGDSQTRAPMVVNTDQIAHFEPLSGSEARSVLVLKDGRQVVVAARYAELRRLLIESRSGFATGLSAGPARA
jgi:hypothetical protein